MIHTYNTDEVALNLPKQIEPIGLLPNLATGLTVIYQVLYITQSYRPKFTYKQK